MFRYSVRIDLKVLHVLDVLVHCQRHVALYAIGAQAKITPKEPMELIGEAIKAYREFNPLDEAIVVWANEIQKSSSGHGTGVVSVELHDKLLNLLQCTYGELPKNHPDVEDLDQFNAMHQEVLKAFSTAPLTDFEAEASIKKAFGQDNVVN